MSQVYVLVDHGPAPVKIEEARDHLRLHSDADDGLLTRLILASTVAAESYTRRDLRANQWELLLDEFEDRICVRRDPVATIDSVEHVVSGSDVTVPASTYYLKRGVQAWEILLAEDQAWPTDTDDREQAIKVTFTTEAPRRWIEPAKSAILRLVAHLYENRGDCDPVASGGAPMMDVVRKSGAGAILDQFRVSRV